MGSQLQPWPREEKTGMDPTNPGVLPSISLQSAVLFLSDSMQRPHPALGDVTFWQIVPPWDPSWPPSQHPWDTQSEGVCTQPAHCDCDQ